jgi:hypothetical protein
MRMGVDESRHDEVPGQVEHLVIIGRVGRLGPGSCAGNASVADGYEAVLERPVNAVHGQHAAAEEERRTHLTPVR